MAQFQWMAASETIGQPPLLLENSLTADGQLLTHWQIVSEPTASSGKALKMIGAATLRRRLTLPGATSSGRVDIRGRMYIPSGSTSHLHFAVARHKGTGAADGYDFFSALNSSGVPQVYAYATAADNIVQGNAQTWTGWVRFRYTCNHGNAPAHRLSMWRESGSGSDTTPDAVISTSASASGVTGTEIGLGAFAASDDLIDWITIGTDGDNATAEPVVSPSGTRGVRLQLFNGSTPQANITDLTAVWFDYSGSAVSLPAPAYSTAIATTDASGWIELDLEARTNLLVGATGYLLVYKAGASAQDDLVFFGRVAIEDIS